MPRRCALCRAVAMKELIFPEPGPGGQPGAKLGAPEIALLCTVFFGKQNKTGALAILVLAFLHTLHVFSDFFFTPTENVTFHALEKAETMRHTCIDIINAAWRVNVPISLCLLCGFDTGVMTYKRKRKRNSTHTHQQPPRGKNPLYLSLRYTSALGSSLQVKQTFLPRHKSRVETTLDWTSLPECKKRHL